MTRELRAIRALQATDLLPYLSFCKKASPHYGLATARLGASGPALTDFLSVSLPLETARQSWIYTQGGEITGLIAVRAGPGLDTWEVDRLACRDKFQDEVCGELLRHLCTVAWEEGIQKIFLRAETPSPLMDTAKQAGFWHYTTEQLYRLAAVPSLAPPCISGLRPRRGADHHALFRLYCAAVPGQVRQVEGMTLQEWRWADGWRLRPAQWGLGLPLGRHDFVLSREDEIEAWLQLAYGSRSLKLICHPREQGAVGHLLDYALAKLPVGGEALCAVRDYQGGLGAPLEERGFAPVAQHALLVRALTLRVPKPKLVPVRI